MKHKIKIKKVSDDEMDFGNVISPYRGMWRGRCTCRKRVWHFWSFGATLGFALEHLRRDGKGY